MAASRYETANLWWVVTFDRQDHRTTATVTGMPHLLARPVVVGQPIVPGRYEKFTFAESDQDTLIKRVLAEIERRDGPILKGDTDDDSED